MKIKIVNDNYQGKQGLRTGWGFSALIEAGDVPPLLFDTGVDGADLLYNMGQLNIEPKQIGVIVISHAHADHTGGLSDILSINKNAEIYIPASTRARLPGRKVIMVSQPIQISEAVYSTGELKGIEQSLAIKTSKGILVVTGCSHPGVGTILDASAQYGKVYGIIGGFHGFRDFTRLDGLSLICPCHCTQHKSELRHLFPEQYVACGAGLEVELS
jgi:7,8-dihydropterin-6-yl-methyl-4-(beta-D-ribofuranosyl)aminobenzene 5'-phosphate synthase